MKLFTSHLNNDTLTVDTRNKSVEENIAAIQSRLTDPSLTKLIISESTYIFNVGLVPYIQRLINENKNVRHIALPYPFYSNETTALSFTQLLDTIINCAHIQKLKIENTTGTELIFAAGSQVYIDPPTSSAKLTILHPEELENMIATRYRLLNPETNSGSPSSAPPSCSHTQTAPHNGPTQ